MRSQPIVLRLFCSVVVVVGGDGGGGVGVFVDAVFLLLWLSPMLMLLFKQHQRLI